MEDEPVSPEAPAIPDLQEVLTRYVDSREGYLQAAALMENPGLSAAFAEISERRRVVGSRVEKLIRREGDTPELGGSAEGAIHRWWIRLREKFSAEELKAVLEECVRGEKILAGALQNAQRSADLAPEQAAVLRDALDEVNLAIEHFETAVKE